MPQKPRRRCIGQRFTYAVYRRWEIPCKLSASWSGMVGRKTNLGRAGPYAILRETRHVIFDPVAK